MGRFRVKGALTKDFGSTEYFRRAASEYVTSLVINMQQLDDRVCVQLASSGFAPMILCWSCGMRKVDDAYCISHQPILAGGTTYL